MFFDEDGDLAHEFYEEVIERRRTKFSNIRQPMLKLKPHSGFHELF
jgi:hypothetical protein